MDTFLPPIEKPKGLMMKLADYFTRRQFGKVLTPLLYNMTNIGLNIHSDMLCDISRQKGSGDAVQKETRL
jgi:hypothetical protein